MTINIIIIYNYPFSVEAAHFSFHKRIYSIFNYSVAIPPTIQIMITILFCFYIIKLDCLT